MTGASPVGANDTEPEPPKRHQPCRWTVTYAVWPAGSAPPPEALNWLDVPVTDQSTGPPLAVTDTVQLVEPEFMSHPDTTGVPGGCDCGGG